MQETWVQSLGQEDPLEKGMATHAGIFLPGEFHGQRSLVGYKSMGLQRVRYDLATKQQSNVTKFKFLLLTARQINKSKVKF